MESAAVRDIGEASVYVGMCSRALCAGYFLTRYGRLRCTKTISQNRLLRVLCYPLTRCVQRRPCSIEKLIMFLCLSCPCTISHRTKEPCSTPQGAVEGRQEGEPCCCCRGGCQGSCEGNLGVTDARCFIIARYLYHAFKVAIKGFSKRFKKKRDETIEPWVDERGPCVRNLLLAPTN